MSNKDIYRHFCKDNKELSLFVQDWYMDVFTDCDWDVAIAYRGDEIVGTMPFMIKQKGIFKYVTMPDHIRSMGPYILPEWRKLNFQHKIMGELIDQLPKLDSFIQYFHRDINNWLPFYWKGYQQKTRYTYVLDNLNDLDQLLKDTNRNVKRSIRKAEKIVQLKEDLPIETFYEINKMSYDRSGSKYPYDFKELVRLDTTLAKHNARKIFYAEDANGNIHSVAYLIWDKQASYYHLSGDDPKLRESGAGIFLVWESIKYTKNVLGLDTFDFEGSMVAPIERIRRRFGAVQKPYFEVWKHNSKLYEMLLKLKG